ncbi:MAG: YfhO family protein [Anaerolineales bacterium]|jgi:hypothetical protein|nr:YfhO family protein [Anaerolineales bacterium]
MQTSSANPALRRTITSLWILLLPLLLLIPGLAGFPYPSAEAVYSDLTLTHYPYAIYLRQALAQYAEPPLWSGLLFSGSPFAANPLSGMGYPPGWLALILPLPLGFNLLILLHLLWGGVGMAFLLRAEGLGEAAAVFGGLAFTALPKLYAHYGAGHLTLLYAIPWTPWLLLACRANLSRGWTPRWRAWVSWEAPLLALIFLADPRWALFAGLLWWGYGMFGIFPVSEADKAQSWRARLAALSVQTAWAALLAAPLAIPLIEFTRLSTRSAMSPGDVLAFSLPWGRALGLVIPDFQGFHEYMLYAGQGLILLAALALFRGFYRRGGRFWLVVFTSALLFALGGNLPGAEGWAGLPFFSLLRAPSRALFLAGIALIMLAARGLQAILDGVGEGAQRTARLVLTGYAGALLALAGGVWFLTRELPANFSWAGGFALGAAAWIGLGVSTRLERRIWIAGLALLCLLDWVGVDRTLFTIHPAAQVLAEKAALAQRLKQLEEKEGVFRVYSPSYSLPQQTAALNGLELADGVDPLHLQAYAEFMRRATGVPQSGYSVTLPPFANGDPQTANQAYQPDPEMLGLLNVRFVASEFELTADGLVFEGRDGATYLYRNLLAQPRAWVVADDAPAGEAPRRVESLAWTPNRISLTAAGPGLLVLSEVAYPGWQAFSDGTPAVSEPYLSLLRAVRLSPGLHTVVFEFRPFSVYLGLGVGLAFGLVWLALMLWKWRSPLGKRPRLDAA